MKIKEYKEMMAYLTRPDNGMKLFKNSKFSQNNKKLILKKYLLENQNHVPLNEKILLLYK